MALSLRRLFFLHAGKPTGSPRDPVFLLWIVACGEKR